MIKRLILAPVILMAGVVSVVIWVLGIQTTFDQNIYKLLRRLK